MPIYEYRCSSCGSEHEALQKLSDAPLVTCPSCHKDTLSKLVSAAGFQLKGSGWYATDFRNGSKPTAKTDKTDKSEKSDAPAGDAKTGETKPGGGAGESGSGEAKSAAAPASCGGGCSCH